MPIRPFRRRRLAGQSWPGPAANRRCDGSQQRDDRDPPPRLIISYYLFLRYTKLNHDQQLLNQAIDHFKNDQQNYAFIEKKNNELYKLRHDLKYDYLQMKEYVKRKEFENVNEMIDKRIKSLNDHNMLIISGNKLFDSFINMKLEQLKLNNIKPAIIVSIQDISFIED